MDAQANMNKQKSPFFLNKTKVSELGFNLSSDQKLYQQLACPFEQDTTKAHPLNAKYPQNFYTFQFSFDKVAGRLNDEVMFYIFYNVMDQRMQLAAGRFLMKNKYRYSKQDKIWVRKLQGKFQYFNIVQWKFTEYTGPKGNQMFCTQVDFAEK